MRKLVLLAVFMLALASFSQAETVDSSGSMYDSSGVCTDVYKPVCGSDGKTYSNECFANSAGVRVVYSGECKIQVVCTADYRPVCGTNGVTYGNECEAGKAGVKVLYAGECEKASCKDSDYGKSYYKKGEVTQCAHIDCVKSVDYCSDGSSLVEYFCDGTRASSEKVPCKAGCVEGACSEVSRSYCGSGTAVKSKEDCYCKESESKECAGSGVIAASGDGSSASSMTCKCIDVRPEVCTTQYEPVCGSDGRTYSNECEAHKAGVKVSYAGKCRAQNCVEVYKPVCGSDGKTYSNECYAKAAGIKIAYVGECRKGCPEGSDETCVKEKPEKPHCGSGTYKDCYCKENEIRQCLSDNVGVDAVNGLFCSCSKKEVPKHVYDIKLASGWNLVGASVLPLPGSGVVKSDCAFEDFRLYSYYPVEKRYGQYRLAGADLVKQDISGRVVVESSSAKYRLVGKSAQDTELLFKYHEGASGFLVSTVMNGWWVYSKSPCSISFMLKKELEDPGMVDYVSSRGLKLVKGWNFLMMSRDMVGHGVSDFKGTCTVGNAYVFNHDSNSWEALGKVQESSVGRAFIMEVGDDCVLGFAEDAVSPPIFPSSPVQG